MQEIQLSAFELEAKNKTGLLLSHAVSQVEESIEEGNQQRAWFSEDTERDEPNSLGLIFS